jgi:hypothetical protein
MARIDIIQSYDITKYSIPAILRACDGVFIKCDKCDDTIYRIVVYIESLCGGPYRSGLYFDVGQVGPLCLHKFSRANCDYLFITIQYMDKTYADGLLEERLRRDASWSHYLFDGGEKYLGSD